jgi:hypothetical protein
MVKEEVDMNWLFVAGVIAIAAIVVLVTVFYRTPFEMGEEDFLAGFSRTDNPYDRNTWQYNCWNEGYDFQVRMSKVSEQIKNKEEQEK